jgi:hypothetical protein
LTATHTVTYAATGASNLSGAAATEDASNFLVGWRNEFSTAVSKRLRVLCGHLHLEFAEGSEPWSTIRRLVAFRNNVVHARPEPLETEEFMAREHYEKREFERPESKVEKQLTPGHAARAVKASQMVIEIILNRLTPEKRFALHEGCLGHTQVCNPPDK